MKKVLVAAMIWVAVTYCVDSYLLHGKYYEVFLRKAGQVYQRVRYSGPHGSVVITGSLPSVC